MCLKGLWQLIWWLHIPSKVKFFVWKLFMAILPSNTIRYNLKAIDVRRMRTSVVSCRGISGNNRKNTVSLVIDEIVSGCFNTIAAIDRLILHSQAKGGCKTFFATASAAASWFKSCFKKSSSDKGGSGSGSGNGGGGGRMSIKFVLRGNEMQLLSRNENPNSIPAFPEDAPPSTAS
ncbi:Hypothetical predicted protein [Olea europaea subsp. europaea]|uniref:Uncharacterized protein n=1 Tax=Olea europaea subsp. europaea TaxID=158383 RepID=A0A8S0S3C2_OLEEU|nr:Hypothetical predicted protein [Olea europaea subsp. europaea]